MLGVPPSAITIASIASLASRGVRSLAGGTRQLVTYSVLAAQLALALPGYVPGSGPAALAALAQATATSAVANGAIGATPGIAALALAMGIPPTALADPAAFSIIGVAYAPGPSSTPSPSPAAAPGQAPALALTTAPTAANNDGAIIGGVLGVRAQFCASGAPSLRGPLPLLLTMHTHAHARTHASSCRAFSSLS